MTNKKYKDQNTPQVGILPRVESPHNLLLNILKQYSRQKKPVRYTGRYRRNSKRRPLS